MIEWSLSPIFNSYGVVAALMAGLMLLLLVTPSFGRATTMRRGCLIAVRVGVVLLLLLAMLPLGYNVWGVVLVATAGNYVGALTNYFVGKWGADFFLSRYITIKPETWARAEAFYQRWGRIALFFSWVPIIGDPLTAVAGALHVNLRTFTFWVALGKFTRYLVLLALVHQVTPIW